MPDFKNFDWKSPISVISLISIAISLVYWWFFPKLEIYWAIGNNGSGISVFMSELILYSFLHGGILHILSNILFFVTIGRAIEIGHGREWTWYLWLWTTVFVGIFLYQFSDSPTIGGSGFAMSILAVYAYNLYQHKHSDYKWALLLMVINLVLWFGATVSFMGHFAGALAGYLYARFRHNHPHVQFPRFR